MILVTKEIAQKFAKSKPGEGEDREILAKFFDPGGRGTWYVLDAEVQGNDWICFGYVVSPLGEDCDEYGYFSVGELASVKNRFGLGIERDRHFKGTLRDVLKAVAV